MKALHTSSICAGGVRYCHNTIGFIFGIIITFTGPSLPLSVSGLCTCLRACMCAGFSLVCAIFSCEWVWLGVLFVSLLIPLSVSISLCISAKFVDLINERKSVSYYTDAEDMTHATNMRRTQRTCGAAHDAQDPQHIQCSTCPTTHNKNR
jgi:hypothetical protein